MAYNYVVTVRLIAVENSLERRPARAAARTRHQRKQIFVVDEPYRRCADLSI